MNFLIKTLGCRINKAESEEISNRLIENGCWKRGGRPDLIILNTCCVTNKAEKEVRQTARALKRKYRQSFLIVSGCAVDYWRKKGMDGEMKKILGADLLVENQRKMAIPKLPEVSIAVHTGSGTILTPRVFLKVQDGCNQFCSYCIVPYLRGRSRSENPEKIISKIKELEKMGAKEVILCGVNLADYKYKIKSQKSEITMRNLIELILKETKIPRIRLGSINLEAFDEELISLWKNERLCPHFHIPLQSGCNQILKRMGRRYTFEEFKEGVNKIQRAIKNVNITTDVIAGFPGETEKDFGESMRNIKKIDFGKIHVFRYSQREGTRAASILPQVPDALKKERANRLLALSEELEAKFSRQFIGRKLSVLLEKKEGGVWSGLSGNHIKVQVEGRGLQGKIIGVKIISQKGKTLYGRTAD